MIRFNFHQLGGLKCHAFYPLSCCSIQTFFLFLELEAFILHAAAAAAAKSLQSCLTLLGLTNYKHQDLKEGSHLCVLI